MNLIKKISIIINFILPIFSLVSCFSVIGNTVQIIKWSDGDTLIYMDAKGSKIEARLVNVDTPESTDQDNGFKPTNETGRNIEYFFAKKSYDIAKNIYKKGELINIESFGKDIYKRELVILKKGDLTTAAILIKFGLARVAYWWFDNNFTNKELYFSMMEQAIINRFGFWSFVMDGIFNYKAIPVEMAAQYDFLKKSNQNSRKKRMGLVFKKWERDRKQYPTYFLDKYLI